MTLDITGRGYRNSDMVTYSILLHPVATGVMATKLSTVAVISVFLHTATGKKRC